MLFAPKITEFDKVHNKKPCLCQNIKYGPGIEVYAVLWIWLMMTLYEMEDNQNQVADICKVFLVAFGLSNVKKVTLNDDK